LHCPDFHGDASQNIHQQKQKIQAVRRREGHCRYLALSNDLIYDRFIKHQNYVNKPLKTINCCKNCASYSTHTSTEALNSSKMQRETSFVSFYSERRKTTFRKRTRLSFKAKNNNTTISTYHGWIDVKWNFECRQHTSSRAERKMFHRVDHRNKSYAIFFFCRRLWL
jgi:hypothetical protein